MGNQRNKSRAPIDIYLNKIVDDALHLTRATDISADGIWISKLLEPAKRAKQVGLEFQLPGSDEVIWASGEVVREGGANAPVEGSAIKFTAMADRFRRLIEVYVSRIAGHA